MAHLFRETLDFLDGFITAVYLQGIEKFTINKFSNSQHLHIIIRRELGGDFVSLDFLAGNQEVHITWFEKGNLRTIKQLPEFKDFTLSSNSEFILSDIDEIRKFFIEVEKFI
ncbi:hypothetical protein D3C71_1831490 [compost metagenome]